MWYRTRAVRGRQVSRAIGTVGLVEMGWSETPESVQIIGKSPRIRDAVRSALTVADSGAAILLRGESGTGKELLARAIHRHSDRSAGPFVAVDCAAIPEPLIESTLFGQEEAASGGKSERRRGCFEQALGGTLFLGEVSDLSLRLQAKLLHVLEERVIDRVNGEGPVAHDARVVSATSRELKAEIEAGRFREDLYYRLGVLDIHLPPLRERGDDLRLLAEHFVKLYAWEYGRPVRKLASETLEHMSSYPWHGNVRELRWAMERGVLLAEGDTVLPEHLHFRIRDPSSTTRSERPRVSAFPTLKQSEELQLWRVLAHTGGDAGRAAEILGIDGKTLRRKLKRQQNS